MSTQNSAAKGGKGAALGVQIPATVGFSCELPVRAKQALQHLHEKTKLPMGHHVRLALLRYLISEEVKNMLLEADRFSSEISGCDAELEDEVVSEE